MTEALLLKGALGMTDEQIDHLDGLGYARDDAQAIELVLAGEYDAALFMAPTPVRVCRTSPHPVRACRRSPPTSSPRSRPGCCSTRWLTAP